MPRSSPCRDILRKIQAYRGVGRPGLAAGIRPEQGRNEDRLTISKLMGRGTE